jgi:hypothetical protein
VNLPLRSARTLLSPLAMSLALLGMGALSGCLGVDPPDGVLVCTPTGGCPDATWSCRDNGEGELRCYRGPGEDSGMADAGDAPGMDTPRDTAGLDVPEIDGGIPDGGNFDAGDTGDLDAGMSDGGMPDAGMPDAGPECITEAECPPSPSFCVQAACVMGECTVRARDCSDGRSCTVDACDDIGEACIHNVGTCPAGELCDPDAPGPTGCVDAPDCTVTNVLTACPAMPCTTRTCPAGSCVYTPTVCTEDSNLCTQPTFCDPLTDACRYDAVTCDDDLNACTSAGMCNPTTGACDYPDIVCPMDSSACTLPPVCNTMSGACSQPFDLGSLTNPMACGVSPGTTCAVCTASHPSREAVCAGGVCSDRCMTGRIDVDGLPANGCECTMTGTTDAHDDAAVDANCDGADGEIGGGRHIYVTPTGAGTGNSPASPTNLANAITISTATRREILLAAGTYTINTPLSIVGRSGLVLFGGYNPTFTARPVGMRSLVTTTGANALLVRDVTSLTVDSVDFTTGNQTVASAHTHTVDVINATGVTFIRSNISAGRGAPGSAGTDGRTGADGGPGARGNPGTGTAVGDGGPGGTGGGSAGGAGGDGGAVGLTGRPGDPGGPGCSVAGGPGGPGSMPAICVTGGTGGNGMPGTEGCPGTAGVDGNGGNDRGTLVGGWMPSNGLPGTEGTDGSGGGGGGGGGGVNCGSNDARGGGGGGGGSGGGRGQRGTGGTGGGASIGILVIGSQVTLDRVTIVTAQGGAGGAGGDGGAGGMPGPGNSGGSGFMGGSTGGRGGSGGDGGAGGEAGCGGGGGGGPSVGIYGDGATAMIHVVASVTYTHAAGGPAGPACTVGGRPGAAGASVDTIGVTPF